MERVKTVEVKTYESEMKIQMIVPQLTAARKDALDLRMKQRVKFLVPESFTLLLQTVARNVGEVQQDQVGWGAVEVLVEDMVCRSSNRECSICCKLTADLVYGP